MIQLPALLLTKEREVIATGTATLRGAKFSGGGGNADGQLQFEIVALSPLPGKRLGLIVIDKLHISAASLGVEEEMPPVSSVHVILNIKLNGQMELTK